MIDGFIVAYSGTLDSPFDVTNLFMIPWQTKAKFEAAGQALANQLTSPFIVTNDVDTGPVSNHGIWCY